MKPGQLTQTLKNITPLSWMRFNCLKAMEPLWGGSLLFTTKFPEIPEYNLRNIFLEKSYTKCGGETIPRPFYKKSKLSYLWINILKFYILFSLFALLRTINLLKLSCRPLAFNLSHIKGTFSKIKRGLQLVSFSA